MLLALGFGLGDHENQTATVGYLNSDGVGRQVA